MLVIPFSKQNEGSRACTILLLKNGNSPANCLQNAGANQLCGCRGCSWPVTVYSSMHQKGRYCCYACYPPTLAGVCAYRGGAGEPALSHGHESGIQCPT